MKEELLPTTKNSNTHDIVIHDIVVVYPIKQYRPGKCWITRVKHVVHHDSQWNKLKNNEYAVIGFNERITHLNIRIASETEQLEYKLLNASCISL